MNKIHLIFVLVIGFVLSKPAVAQPPDFKSSFCNRYIENKQTVNSSTISVAKAKPEFDNNKLLKGLHRRERFEKIIFLIPAALTALVCTISLIQ
jgi:hypothetical protein